MQKSEADRASNGNAQHSHEKSVASEGALEAAKKRSVQVARDPYVKISRDDLAALKDEVD